MEKYHLMATECFVLPSSELCFDAMDFVAQLPENFLVHCGRLLSVHWDKRFRNRLLDMPLDHRGEICRQDMSKVI